ncbi:HAD hydrolase-like protein [Mucilaginibacter sp. FT3.2]|uniref:HAD hydrolase-like protein n=1 Tax=Mucilaginibacter sp. FT3.2 TaxID=2723090 RepID=UPI00160D0207|nr:HAD hydrolase-like protein [Mucilaginibacter sp. FT3.2]MBB6232737.1 phosphoglycolate phosphatase [Mucilaginibacter sp. FT3.2]
MKNIRHLIFDFDGTLVDSKSLFIDTYNSVASEYGYKQMEISTLHELKKMSYRERVNYLNVPWWHLPLFITKLYKKYTTFISSLAFFDGIENVLKQINDIGFTMDIVSSNTEENIRVFLAQKKVTCFNKILCSKKVLKKDVLLTKLIKENSYKLSEVLYIGDEARDLEACNKLNIDAIWVAWGYDSKDAVEQHHYAYMANKPEDLINILKNLNCVLI